MKIENKLTALLSEIIIMQLPENAPIPYELLLDADPSKELVDKYLASSEIFIANHQSKTIGVYVLYPVNAERIEIKNIAVAENYQGKGIGKLMLKDASQRAKQNNYKEIIIATSNASIDVLYLYQKAGFEITTILKNFIIDNYPEPLFDHGIQCKHMIVLLKKI